MTNQFKALGTSTEVEECHCCGRTNLKKTVKLGVLDQDGNIQEVVYYGTDCAAKATGWNKQWMRTELSKADKQRRDNEHSAKNFIQLRDAINEVNGLLGRLAKPDQTRAFKILDQILDKPFSGAKDIQKLLAWLDAQIKECLA